MAINSLLHQTSWDIYQKEAWEGQLGNQPASIVIPAVLNVPNNGTKPRPGYPVFYNTDNNAWEYPEADENIPRISGVILYQKSDIVDNNNVVEYDDGAVLEIIIRGSVWGKSLAVLDPTQRVTWVHDADAANRGWNAEAAPLIEDFDPTSDNTASNINAAIEDLQDKTQNAIESFGLTRISSISPRASTANGLFEIYLNGGGIY